MCSRLCAPQDLIWFASQTRWSCTNRRTVTASMRLASAWVGLMSALPSSFTIIDGTISKAVRAALSQFDPRASDQVFGDRSPAYGQRRVQDFSRCGSRRSRASGGGVFLSCCAQKSGAVARVAEEERGRARSLALTATFLASPHGAFLNKQLAEKVARDALDSSFPIEGEGWDGGWSLATQPQVFKALTPTPTLPQRPEKGSS